MRYMMVKSLQWIKQVLTINDNKRIGFPKLESKWFIEIGNLESELV